MRSLLVRIASSLLGCAVVLGLVGAAPASTPFYVSDSFTLTFQDFATTGIWHSPGPANMEKVWGQNEAVTVDVRAGEFGAVAYGSDALVGFNADVYMCLYDLGNIVGGIAQPVLVGGQPVILKYLTTGGAAMSDGLLLNGVHRYGQYARAARALKDPIRLGGVTTPAAGGPFQVGALMRFFGPGGVMSYQYFLQGVADPSVVPAPTGSSTGAPQIAFVEAGALTAGQTKYTGTWAGSVTEADVYTQIIVAQAGTLRNLRVKGQVAPGAGQTHTFTVRKNGVDTGLAITLSDSATAGANLTASVSVAAGDVLTLKGVASAGAATTSVTASVEVGAAI